MREEMERLRSFVGDLARGSRQDQDDPAVTQNGNDQEAHAATIALQQDTERDGGQGVGPGMATTGETSPRHSNPDDSHADADAAIPQALLEVSLHLVLRESASRPADTAHVQNLASAASLIRTLHRAMSRSSIGAVAEQSVHDEHIFSATNLAALEDAVVRSDWARA
jgi:hypothetical protein